MTRWINRMRTLRCPRLLVACATLFGSLGVFAADLPGPIEGGYYLPNGWRITPLGKAIPTEDMLLNIVPAPDGKAMITVHGGFNPHGLVVIDAKTDEAARRTVGLVASPYCKRGIVDSTLYTTSSMLRTIELLLGLQPMSQFGAAANPMYASFGDKPDPAPYTHLKPRIDLNAVNQATAWGAEESMKMNFAEVDQTPMFELNEIIWKNIKGADSPMPLPIHRFHFAGLR